MKATIDFDDALYRRLKVEAARRKRTVRDLVAEGVRRVLDAPSPADVESVGTAPLEWRPAWLGALSTKAARVNDHSMTAVRASVARGRSADKKK